MLFWNIVLFILGLGLIIKGGDWFVDASVWIAKALKIPTFIIGATIVSLATTMPELIVSCIAAAEGETEMAVGNAIGSVTANTALILAIAMVAMPIVFKRSKYLRQCLMLLGAAAITLIGGFLGKDGNNYSLHIAASIVLILIFLYFMFENLRSARKKDGKQMETPDAPLPEKEESAPKPERKKVILNIVLFIIGAAGIVGGSRLLVDNGVIIADALGVPDRVIAVTLVAIGTSLPELVTTITAIVKKEAALSAGNIIGANVIDLTLILPISSLIAGKQLPISADSQHFDIPFCLAISMLAILPLIIREKSSRIQGILLLVAYSGYMGYLVYSGIAV